ncbi:winged helix-turn-helix domain-containing protein [Nonomuraea africana]|uniref:GntR family transcriptional regulator n=1 Tax=Nonomuraea africana TaxID=46171 RepID=A0ABR9K9I5_9ACTN|nr:GntR family transcriptional regulator [Nonomuraea africana]
MEWKPNVPRWVQVYEVIKNRIEDGTYAPGDKLPSVLDLTNTYGIANATAQKVMTQLRQDGLTYTEPGLGTFVRRPSDSSEGR